MRAIFFGTPAIAVPALEALVQIADVVGVVCQPDRPAGRGLVLQPPPVKRRALELDREVVQPEKIRTPEFTAWMQNKAADVAVVLAYGRILPKSVLGSPRRGCLNLHASILPKYRGAAPITWAIVRGETETGVSLMQMEEGLDTGPVYTVRHLSIGSDTTADQLADEISQLAAEVVRGDLLRAVDGTLMPVPQDDAAATLAPLLKKEDGRIQWNQPAKQVHDHVRGMTSWPGAFTTINGKLLKVLSTRVAVENQPEAAPGTVVLADRSTVRIACGTGALHILSAQVEGRKALGAAELVAGRALRTAMVLGS